MEIGVSTSCYYPLETELALEEVGKAGVKNTEVFFNALSELKPTFTDMLLDIKRNYGIKIDSIHSAVPFADSFMIFSAYKRRFYEAVEQYTRYSETAAKLGAKYIIMHGGKPNGILSDEEYCERYMTLKRAVLKNGVTVLHENVAKYRSGDIEFLRSMRSILGEEAEFCFDIKQSVRCGYDPFEMTDEFLGNIRHFHISDHSIASDCQLPFKGGFDFKGFFSFIKNRGYNGSCIIEVYNDAYKTYKELTDSYCETVKLLEEI